VDANKKARRTIFRAVPLFSSSGLPGAVTASPETETGEPDYPNVFRFVDFQRVMQLGLRAKKVE